MAPVALFAAAVMPPAQGKLTLREVCRRTGVGTAAAAGTVLLVGLPWTIADGFTWIPKSYTDFLGLFPSLTMKAFNIWYVDAMSTDSPTTLRGLDPRVIVGGMSKDAWGKFLLIITSLAAAFVCWRKWRTRPGLAVTLLTCLWLWGTYMWPTRVHERYIVLAMPLVIILAAGIKQYWPALVALLILGVAAETSNMWLKTDLTHVGGAGVRARWCSGRYQDYQQQMASWRQEQRLSNAEVMQNCWKEFSQFRRNEWPWEILATAASLLGYAWAFGVVLFKSRTAGGTAKSIQSKGHGKTGGCNGGFIDKKEAMN